jgi:uncharacterized protein (TIGR02466 family)
LTKEILDRADDLIAKGRVQEALLLTQVLVDQPQPSHSGLAAHAAALKLLGKREEALPFNEQAIARFGESGVAWHNYAATLGDLGRGAASKAACEKAFALGLDAAETWGVLARAELAVGDHDAAEAAYRASLKRAPGNFSVAMEFANVAWMRRGNLAEAEAIVDACFVAGGPPAPLLLAKAKLIESAGDPERAADLLGAAARTLAREFPVVLAAAQAALETGRLEEAERLARQAEGLNSEARGLYNQWAIIHLAAGRPQEALAKARKGLEAHPNDQSLLGWAATAARAAGDPLYAEICDYDAMVGVYDIETPSGWDSLEAYLADLATALNGIHLYNQHPSAQSLRHGTQTMYRLTGSRDPAIKAFFKAIDKPMRQHMAGMGEGADPARARRTGDYRIEGAWSVRLNPGGFHKDHFHPEGWLSSAFYVETPDSALDSAEKQGWIRFGQPPYKTDPELPAEHFVRPKPGRLVLFPSYMWHGTVPFTTDERRLTIAFDAVPV